MPTIPCQQIGYRLRSRDGNVPSIVGSFIRLTGAGQHDYRMRFWMTSIVNIVFVIRMLMCTSVYITVKPAFQEPAINTIPPVGEQKPATTKPPRSLDQGVSKAELSGHSHDAAVSMADWCRRYVLFHGKRHPSELGLMEVGAFLQHVADTEKDVLPRIELARDRRIGTNRTSRMPSSSSSLPAGRITRTTAVRALPRTGCPAKGTRQDGGQACRGMTRRERP